MKLAVLHYSYDPLHRGRDNFLNAMQKSTATATLYGSTRHESRKRFRLKASADMDRLKRDGMSYEQIADKYGITYSAAVNILRTYRNKKEK